MFEIVAVILLSFICTSLSDIANELKSICLKREGD